MVPPLDACICCQRACCLTKLPCQSSWLLITKLLWVSTSLLSSLRLRLEFCLEQDCAGYKRKNKLVSNTFPVPSNLQYFLSLDFCWLLYSLLSLTPAGFHILPSPDPVFLFFSLALNSSKSSGFLYAYSLCAVTFPDPFFSPRLFFSKFSFYFCYFLFSLIN